MPGAVDSIEILAPREVVFNVITEYERYPEFAPHVKRIRVIERRPGSSVIEMTTDMVKEVIYSIRLQEEAPVRVSWTLVQGPFKSNEGGWDLEDLGGGRTRATYRVDVNLGIFVPRALVDKMVATSLPANLKAFKARSEALVARG